MLILGYHGGPAREFERMNHFWYHHDAAAILVDDGQLVAAIEEERLNRVKHSDSFPANAIAACLATARATLDDVDLICTNFSEKQFDDWSIRTSLADAQPLMSGRSWAALPFERAFGMDVAPKLRFCRHHLAHAFSALAPSGFSEALVVTLDGAGDDGQGGEQSGLVAVGRDHGMTIVKEYPAFRHSLGAFYFSCIRLLGYAAFDEYKVMGLAPYGDPSVYAALFEGWYKLLPDGEYALASDEELARSAAAGGLLTNLRRRGEPFTKAHQDLAATIQATLERVSFHILKHFRNQTGLKKLCLSGGVAHNSTMNGKILSSGLFEDVFVQPAAHDAGGALGAALAVMHEEGIAYTGRRMRSLSLGPRLRDPAGVENELRRWIPLISIERVGDVGKRTAELIAGGAVVGWVQGRAEFGPRALGNRSILADPRPAENKDRINAMVKKREGYRPFAPSVLEERAREFFEIPTECGDLPFMTFVLTVKEEVRSLLGAVTHVDGTARVQTVSRATNEPYWNLIHEFAKLTGVPVLLNTSFNNHAEPIVESIDDAVCCYLTTGIDYLVVEDWLVKKVDAPASRAVPSYAILAPSVAACWRLLRRNVPDPRTGTSRVVFEMETIPMGMADPRQRLVVLSEALFHILCIADGRRSVAELCRATGIEGAAQIERTTRELVEAWKLRAIRLLPPAPPDVLQTSSADPRA